MGDYLSIDDVLAVTTIESLLRDCGVVGKIVDCGGYYLFRSPYHEDKHPSMILYKENLYCIDWSGEFHGSLSRLLKDHVGKSLYQYLGISQKDRDNNYYKNLGDIEKREKALESYLSSSDTPAPLSMFDMIVKGDISYDLTQNRQAYEYARSRFIDDEFASFFHVGWTANAEIRRILRGRDLNQRGTSFIDRLTIPIYRDGCMVSIEGRDYTRRQEKKCIYPRGGDVSGLFNQDNLDMSQPVILVEGIMDMVRIWQHVSKNVAPTFGIQIAEKQKDIIKKIPDIIVFSDSDEAGERMIRIVDSFYEDREFRVARLKSGDPGDAINSVGDIRRAIDNSVSCNEYFLSRSGYLDTFDTPNDEEFFNATI